MIADDVIVVDVMFFPIHDLLCIDIIGRFKRGKREVKKKEYTVRSKMTNKVRRIGRRKSTGHVVANQNQDSQKHHAPAFFSTNDGERSSVKVSAEKDPKNKSHDHPIKNSSKLEGVCPPVQLPTMMTRTRDCFGSVWVPRGMLERQLQEIWSTSRRDEPACYSSHIGVEV